MSLIIGGLFLVVVPKRRPWDTAALLDAICGCGRLMILRTVLFWIVVVTAIDALTSFSP